jgi:hypothetical protein
MSSSYLDLKRCEVADRGLFRGNALPGQLAVLLAPTYTTRRRREDHATALKAHATHLIAADAAGIRCRIDRVTSRDPSKV